MGRKIPTSNGRDKRSGRFLPGNPGGPGNPHLGRLERFRAALLKALTEKDIEAVIRALLRKAKRGNVIACRELLDRAVGKATIAARTPQTFLVPTGGGLFRVQVDGSVWPRQDLSLLTDEELKTLETLVAKLEHAEPNRHLTPPVASGMLEGD